ncbi:MAG TPA: hypothetical protein VMT14_16105 [Burkholderiaceae bacterium]|nr:hypothetical protein [Burkholderiaceae bacterium]
MSPPLSPTSTSTADLPSGVPGSVSDPAIERVARGAHSAVDRVAGTVERVRTGVQGALGTVNERMHDLQSNGDVWVDTARERVREHPLATVGIALAAGYLLARILRS